MLIKRRDLLLYCFDPNHARAIGLLRGRVALRVCLSLLSLTIVSSIKAVGIILVIAMLIAPGATAYILSDRFEWMLVIAVVVACSSAALGTFISFHIDGATGACIVLVQALIVFSHGLSVRAKARPLAQFGKLLRRTAGEESPKGAPGADALSLDAP